MGLNETPSADRVHIGFFGRRNAGKSSVVNAVTGQDLAVVSEIKGTTTDPVHKAMELLPLGPVMIIDTPGIDDEGPLGDLRVRKTRQVLNKTDVAVLIIDSTVGKTEADDDLIKLFKEKQINHIVVYNKSDLAAEPVKQEPAAPEAPENISGIHAGTKAEQDKGVHIGTAAGQENKIHISAKTGYNINKLKKRIAELAVTEEPRLRIVGDIIEPSDFVVLVTPIDKAAPKGRLILPQQQTIRDILEADAAAIVVKEFELRETLEHLAKKPKLVITDSQVFAKVSADTPNDIFLTSFSILFARYKGGLESSVKGAKALDSLEDGDAILISEGCTHHRQCDDIGTVKLPRWIRNYSQKQFNFKFTAGTEFPDDLSEYKLIVHCGGCMVNEREMTYRRKCAEDQGVPMTNYGVLIAFMQGILKRSVAMFPHILAEIED